MALDQAGRTSGASRPLRDENNVSGRCFRSQRQRLPESGNSKRGTTALRWHAGDSTLSPMYRMGHRARRNCSPRPPDPSPPTFSTLSRPTNRATPPCKSTVGSEHCALPRPVPKIGITNNNARETRVRPAAETLYTFLLFRARFKARPVIDSPRESGRCYRAPNRPRTHCPRAGYYS